MGENLRSWGHIILVVGAGLFWAGCSKPTYPKEKLEESVRELFLKELKVEPESQLTGKTLYVSFELKDLVTENFDLPKDVAEKLEGAMLAVNRIMLSTDADLEFAVLEARDLDWGVQTTLIRRVQDLKNLLYMRVGQKDFDERLILETKKIVESVDQKEDWHPLSLEEFMSRWIASRISLGAKANPFMGALLGIDKMTGRYDSEQKAARLIVDGYRGTYEEEASTPTLVTELLRSSVCEQVAQVEKKYSLEISKLTAGAVHWTDKIFVESREGVPVFHLERKDWEPDGKKQRARKKIDTRRPNMRLLER